ncbi:MAG TPA: hypothetical protein EYP41_10665 [Anaerolineae bacterium]|nr:hypothetical protein [Anaerolineae bacterium]
MQTQISRRQFIRLSALGSGGLLLAACGVSTQPLTPTTVPPTAVPPTKAAAAAQEEKVLISDVLDYQLTSDEWPGDFGSVTFKLHEGQYNGEPIYFIRTDAGDSDFAAANGLVFVPLLNAGRDVAAPLYVFGDGRAPVFSRTPAEETYTSLFQIKNVTVSDDSADLSSAEAIEQAVSDGKASLEDGSFVNFPVVKWPGGELAEDTERETYLGTGQLLGPVDTDKMTVTFKLHQCFPGSRYIITDTSIAAMAPMMSIPASPPNAALMDTGATDEIWVFANGLAGSGVMGFQPAIFDNQAGQPAWSPFWNHFTVKWTDESKAKVLRNSTEIRDLISSGDLELFNGVPDSHPTGFVVNCPVPVLAPNTFTG